MGLKWQKIKERGAAERGMEGGTVWENSLTCLAQICLENGSLREGDSAQPFMHW